MMKILERVNGCIWGVPLLVLILGCGIYLTIRTGCVQIRLFPGALKRFCRQFRGGNKSDTSGYRALCTALSATVGTGNIAGVAGAIALGGPGAIFWMWIFAFFGMAVKFAEATLAVFFRKRNADGSYNGGPMYIIEKGLGKSWRLLGTIYSFFGVFAAFGVGNATQINTVITGINGVIQSFGGRESFFVDILVGVILSVLIGRALFGGAKRIGNVAQKLIPFACIGYIVICCVTIILRIDCVKSAFRSIFLGAFTPGAVTSGVLGSAFLALRVGASRGLFTNEAGMGTAGIAHSTAEVEHPVQQGMFGIIEVFLDTIVICTLTALVILTSGVIVVYGVDTGLSLTVQAFSSVLGSWIQIPITVFLCLFAFATVLGWGLYGTMCAAYLFGTGSLKAFCWTQMIVVIVSVVLKTQTVWLLSEAVNGLMALPNLISLVALSPEVIRLTREYKKSPPRVKRRGSFQETGQIVSVPFEVS